MSDATSRQAHPDHLRKLEAERDDLARRLVEAQESNARYAAQVSDLQTIVQAQLSRIGSLLAFKTQAAARPGHTCTHGERRAQAVHNATSDSPTANSTVGNSKR